MSVKYEYYNTNDDDDTVIYATFWRGETFSPVTAHTITSIKLLLYRVGSPGTMTVSIRATSGGNPTGNDLCSGTIDGNTLTNNPASAWYEITLGVGCNLSASTQYAIVARVAGLNDSNCVGIRGDWSSPSYAGGDCIYSSDSGVTWAPPFTTIDLMFEEWGTALVVSRSFGFIIG